MFEVTSSVRTRLIELFRFSEPGLLRSEFRFINTDLFFSNNVQNIMLFDIEYWHIIPPCYINYEVSLRDILTCANFHCRDSLFIIVSGLYAMIVMVIGCVMPIANIFATKPMPYLFEVNMYYN